MNETDEDFPLSARKLLGRWFFGQYIVFAPDQLAAREIHQMAKRKPEARGAEVLADGRGGYWIRWRESLPQAGAPGADLDPAHGADLSADTPACQSWPNPPWS
jgi:hypothetical protein